MAPPRVFPLSPDFEKLHDSVRLAFRLRRLFPIPRELRSHLPVFLKNDPLHEFEGKALATVISLSVSYPVLAHLNFAGQFISIILFSALVLSFGEMVIIFLAFSFCHSSNSASIP